MRDHKAIKKVLDSAVGQELKDFIISQIEELNSLDSVKDLDDKEQLAIETKANKKAVKKLRNIFSQILTWSDKQSKKNEKDNYYSL